MTDSVPRTIKHGTHGGYTRGKCRCDGCSAAMREYQIAYRERNRSRIVEQERAHHRANADRRNRERRKRYAANVAHEHESAVDRYRRNREARVDTAIAWARANPERRQAHRSSRKAAKRAAGISLVTGRDWIRLCRRFDFRCAYCGTRASLTQDHVVPIARGGRHAIGNLLPACMSCNASKGPRLLVEWRAHRIKE